MGREISDMVIRQIKALSMYRGKKVLVASLSAENGGYIDSNEGILTSVDGLNGIKLPPYYIHFVGENKSISKIYNSHGRVIYENPIITFENLSNMNRLSLLVNSFGEDFEKVIHNKPDLHMASIPGMFY